MIISSCFHKSICRSRRLETNLHLYYQDLPAKKQEDLEDIGYNEKSDVRVMIEKFVDENPEAVAALLRNWLNEDWE